MLTTDTLAGLLLTRLHQQRRSGYSLNLPARYWQTSDQSHPASDSGWFFSLRLSTLPPTMRFTEVLGTITAYLAKITDASPELTVCSL
ncbi:MAG: hypothetical protein GPOALKHO_000685 [Sodalis sp.]|nr:MAG: hypothetical protein GPOALKHO_000685 [Sodalis sp.]